MPSCQGLVFTSAATTIDRRKYNLMDQSLRSIVWSAQLINVSSSHCSSPTHLTGRRRSIDTPFPLAASNVLFIYLFYFYNQIKNNWIQDLFQKGNLAKKGGRICQWKRTTKFSFFFCFLSKHVVILRVIPMIKSDFLCFLGEMNF